MQTYKKEVEEKRLKIMHDDSLESPREWSNLGKFIAISNRYSSPDNDEYFIGVVKDTAEEATSQENHIELIKKAIENDTDDTVVLIVPICKYEHSSISYSVGTKRGFDYSNNGFYIVMQSGIDELGVENTEENLLSIIKSEIETYNKYVNGEVYGFELLSENGEFEDSCWGFYNIEDIKEHLPAEFENEDLEQYLEY